MTLDDFLAEWRNSEERILVHTSGSTGAPKPLWVEKSRMAASARITCEFLGLHRGDTALLCLPLDFIAGKMMVVRALTRGLRLLHTEPSGHPLHSLDIQWEEDTLPWCDLAAMVPMQVYNTLQVEEESHLLKGIRHLIIGGGSIPPPLALALKDFPHAIWSTYGMTETLSHIALRRLNGPEASEWYTPFESVIVEKDKDDCLVITAPQVAPDSLPTHDIVEFAPDGRRFKILGRKDNVICSGGIKIQMEEVEQRLQTYLKTPFMITKCKDDRLGEAAVLLTEENDLVEVKMICEHELPRLQRPRHILHIDHIPTTANGKPARAIAEEYYSKSL